MSDGKATKKDLATAPPPFDPEEYARESESMVVGKPVASPSMKPTMPPDPFYQELRESCSDHMPVAEIVDDGSDWQSEVRVLSTAPLPRDMPPFEAVPYLAMQADDLAWFELGPDARRILALIDGCNCVGVVLTKSPAGVDETGRVLAELLNLGVIELR
jgi:hypothetical protein